MNTFKILATLSAVFLASMNFGCFYFSLFFVSEERLFCLSVSLVRKQTQTFCLSNEKNKNKVWQIHLRYLILDRTK